MHVLREERSDASEKRKMFDKCLTNIYNGGMSSKIVKTREFLRNFKALKEQLTSGHIHFVTIDIGDNQELEVTLRSRSNTGKNLAKSFSSLPKPIHIRRTRVFDTLFH